MICVCLLIYMLDSIICPSKCWISLAIKLDFVSTIWKLSPLVREPIRIGIDYGLLKGWLRWFNRNGSCFPYTLNTLSKSEKARKASPSTSDEVNQLSSLPTSLEGQDMDVQVTDYHAQTTFNIKVVGQIEVTFEQNGERLMGSVAREKLHLSDEDVILHVGVIPFSTKRGQNSGLDSLFVNKMFGNPPT